MNQSELEANCQVRENVCGLLLFLIGWESGERFANQSHNRNKLTKRYVYTCEFWCNVFCTSLQSSLHYSLARSQLQIALASAISLSFFWEILQVYIKFQTCSKLLWYRSQPQICPQIASCSQRWFESVTWHDELKVAQISHVWAGIYSKRSAQQLKQLQIKK